MLRSLPGFALVVCLLAPLADFPAASEESAVPVPETLTFPDLVPASPIQRFSERVAGLQGRTVRIIGFMAHSEDPPKGIFYLCQRPVSLDEGGAGTADLPPTSIRVSVPALAGRPVPFLPRPLEVTGTLDLGYREEADGSVSWIRLTVDLPPVPAGNRKPDNRENDSPKSHRDPF